MVEFWSTVSPILNFTTVGLLAWAGKSLVNVKVELAEIKVRLSHLEGDVHRGDR